MHGQHVQLGGEVAERRAVGQRALESEQCGRGPGLDVEQGTRDEVGDDAHAVQLLDVQARVGDGSGDLRGGPAARRWPPRS